MRTRLGIILALALSVVMAGAGSAAEFPAKEVQIVIPWPAGGVTPLATPRWCRHVRTATRG